jgi:hypothetical protein
MRKTDTKTTHTTNPMTHSEDLGLRLGRAKKQAKRNGVLACVFGGLFVVATAALTFAGVRDSKKTKALQEAYQQNNTCDSTLKEAQRETEMIRSHAIARDSAMTAMARDNGLDQFALDYYNRAALVTAYNYFNNWEATQLYSSKSYTALQVK